MFGGNYFIWLAISFAIIGILLFCSLKFKFSIKICVFIMAGISIASELLKTFVHMRDHIDMVNRLDVSQSMIDGMDPGMTLLVKSLPLHLCSILVFFILYIAFSKNEEKKQKVLNFYAPIALLGGFLGVVMSTSGTSFTTPQAYQSFVYHSALVWFGLHTLITKKVDMGLKTYLRNLIILAAMTFSMIWINAILTVYDTNFFFVVSPPFTIPGLYNIQGWWYLYFAGLVLVGVVLITALHLPYIIIEAKKKKQKNNIG